MNDITVNKAELITKITENRAGHRAIFEEALEGYRKQNLERLEKLIEDISSGKVVQVSVRMPFPEDHTSDYDRVLAMLEMDVSDEVRLSEHDFASYVLDDWAWKQAFLTSNSSYSVTAMAKLNQ